jgi:oxaloacetate decarboxylase (Na+ extruding) subunit alpha
MPSRQYRRHRHRPIRSPLFLDGEADVAAAKLQVRLDDSTTELTVNADGSVAIDANNYTVEAIEPGLYRVSDGTRRWTVAVAGPSDARWISVEGHTYVVEVGNRESGVGDRRKTRASGHDAMTAPMPATVMKILVEPGAQVGDGDTVIVLEAMKMELAVRTPRAGVVETIHCKVGELVQPGVVLLELE